MAITPLSLKRHLAEAKSDSEQDIGLAAQLQKARMSRTARRLRELQPRPRDSKSAALHDRMVAGQRRLARAGYGALVAAFEKAGIDFGPMFPGFDDPRELAKCDPTTLTTDQLQQLLAYVDERKLQEGAHVDPHT
jgi:hypothetical protein